MAEPFLGELKIVAFNFPPKGWAFANGQLLAINQNQALFSLFGTTYGGDGRTTFALPNVQGRTPIHVGNGFTLGERGGETAHTITASELPQHNHTVRASSSATGGNSNPTGRYLGGANNAYQPPGGPATTMHPATVANAGSNQPHENMQPYLVLNFCVALQGIFPSQN